MTIAICTLPSRFTRSLLTRVSSSLRRVQLLVHRVELLVGRLQLLLGGVQLLVGRLQLLVAREDLLVGRLQLLVGGLQLLDDRLEVLAAGRELLLAAERRAGGLRAACGLARRRRRPRPRRFARASKRTRKWRWRRHRSAGRPRRRRRASRRSTRTRRPSFGAPACASCAPRCSAVRRPCSRPSRAIFSRFRLASPGAGSRNGPVCPRNWTISQVLVDERRRAGCTGRGCSRFASVWTRRTSPSRLGDGGSRGTGRRGRSVSRGRHGESVVPTDCLR